MLESPNRTAEPLPQAPTRRLLKEGARARIYEVTLPPHTVGERHTHECPGMTVLGTAGTLGEAGDTAAASGGTGAGHWTWRNAGFSHTLSNTGDLPLTVYEIDWR